MMQVTSSRSDRGERKGGAWPALEREKKERKRDSDEVQNKFVETK